MNDDSRGTYITNSKIKFKTSMLKSNLCDYIYAYILVNGIIIITGAVSDATARQTDEKYDYISEINNTQIDNAKDLDAVMQYYRDAHLAGTGTFKWMLKYKGL